MQIRRHWGAGRASARGRSAKPDGVLNLHRAPGSRLRRDAPGALGSWESRDTREAAAPARPRPGRPRSVSPRESVNGDVPPVTSSAPPVPALRLPPHTHPHASHVKIDQVPDLPPVGGPFSSSSHTPQGNPLQNPFPSPTNHPNLFLEPPTFPGPPARGSDPAP